MSVPDGVLVMKCLYLMVCVGDEVPVPDVCVGDKCLLPDGVVVRKCL